MAQILRRELVVDGFRNRLIYAVIQNMAGNKPPPS